MARCLRRENKIDQALSTVDTVLAAKPDSAPAWKLKANCLNDIKQYEGALDACRKALALSREDDSLKRLIVKLEERLSSSVLRSDLIG
ncbi:tetratricopeptide repeat protein [Polaromonas sp. JS666]|uniref:tetratricopeptide repeat protein n=1 Tax=Polaromonas sp. (strain JS666 / ATCC BAA-500) TaxID=296591 RepID=UPI0000538065|nr:TPR repeat [Polaromonas sp. JS666]